MNCFPLFYSLLASFLSMAKAPKTMTDSKAKTTKAKSKVAANDNMPKTASKAKTTKTRGDGGKKKKGTYCA